MHLALTIQTFEDPQSRVRPAQTNSRYVLQGEKVYEHGEISDDRDGSLAEMEGRALARQRGATSLTIHRADGSVVEVKGD